MLAEAASAELCADHIAQPLVPVAAFTGTSRSYRLRLGDADGRLDVLEGALRGITQEQPACRVQLAGPAVALACFAAELATQVRITVPRAGLAADAVAVATGVAPAPRHLGAPTIPPGLDVAQAMRLVVGHLADVILHWAPLVPAAATPEPVHQMRVAVRRLRSALRLFRRAGDSDALNDLAEPLQALAARLGAARDWDVFLGGAATLVRDAFPADPRLGALAAAAGRKRVAAYAALRDYLHADGWRLMALRLALLPTAEPWRDPADAARQEALAAPMQTYAADTLNRLHRRLLAAGADWDQLPPAALHEVRKRAKTLRYAVEFCAPMFPPRRLKRFLGRLEKLQEALGAVNDAHVAASLAGQLGGGADRAFAAGAVQGYVAARSSPAAARATKSWTKFGRQEIFWT